MFHGQAQVGDDRRAVLLHQDVFRLEVSVSDAGFAYKQTNTTEEENYTRELVRFMDGKVKYDLKFEN